MTLETEPHPHTLTEIGIASIAVVGAGTMGNGIAQVFAQIGTPVTLIEIAPEALKRGIQTIERNLARGVEKGRITEQQAQQTKNAITPSSQVSDAQTTDLCVEAITERLDAKLGLIQNLSSLMKPTAIIASNTSSISLTRLAAAAENPNRVIGMHFFNPVPVLPLIEIVRALQTSDETALRAERAAIAIGKTPVVVNDAPGFVGNRILLPMINEAIFCLAEGVANREAIDNVMKLGMAHPMGPLALADLIGLDVCLDILEVLHRDFGDDKYRPAPLLRTYVAAGKLGRKTGSGFYDYTTSNAK